MTSKQNKIQELEHAKKILHDPEFYWNSGTPAGLKGSLRRAQWVMNAAQMNGGKTVLEIGCGTGFFSEVFCKEDIKLHGIDLSERLLSKARERCGEKVRFYEGDVEILPFADETFDAIVGIRVLHHLDMNAAFKEIVRTLKKGGRIAFCEPNMLNPQIMIQKNIPFIKRWMGDTPDETAFFKWTLRRFLKQWGFSEIHINPFDFLHPWVPAGFVRIVDRMGRVLERCPGVREIAGSLEIYAVKS
jgi:ubiquinone/menaquinone biosynthesis C-methylase UbiE